MPREGALDKKQRDGDAYDIFAHPYMSRSISGHGQMEPIGNDSLMSAVFQPLSLTRTRRGSRTLPSPEVEFSQPVLGLSP